MNKEEKAIESQARERYLHIKECVKGAGWGIFVSEYVNPILDSWGDIRSLPKDLTPEEMKMELDSRRNAIERLEEVLSAFTGEMVQYEDNTPDSESQDSYVERIK